MSKRGFSFSYPNVKHDTENIFYFILKIRILNPKGRSFRHIIILYKALVKRISFNLVFFKIRQMEKLLKQKSPTSLFSYLRWHLKHNGVCLLKKIKENIKLEIASIS